MFYALKVALVGLIWAAIGLGYGAGMGLALGWGSYTLIPAAIATAYAIAAYIHFWRTQNLIWPPWELTFSMIPWYLMLGSVTTSIVFAIWFTNVHWAWCGLYVPVALALLYVTGCEAFEQDVVLDFVPRLATNK